MKTYGAMDMQAIIMENAFEKLIKKQIKSVCEVTFNY
jgi:hypothetical protein